jgi:hypothetical protein
MNGVVFSAATGSPADPVVAASGSYLGPCVEMHEIALCVTQAHEAVGPAQASALRVARWGKVALGVCHAQRTGGARRNECARGDRHPQPRRAWALASALVISMAGE